MPIYKIADLNILINPVCKTVERLLAPYITQEEQWDFEASFSKNQIISHGENSKIPCTPSQSESSLILTKISNVIREQYSGFFFHSSSLMLDGNAYVFTAPSGTGKSTHAALWRDYFKDRVTMINDDKPIIRKRGEKFYIFGTPWMGKSNIGNNICAPVKAVYVLNRGTENHAEKTTPGRVFKRILQATVVPTDKEKMLGLLNLLNDFFSSVELYSLTCNISTDAVITAYNAANKSDRKDSILE